MNNIKKFFLKLQLDAQYSYIFTFLTYLLFFNTVLKLVKDKVAIAAHITNIKPNA